MPDPEIFDDLHHALGRPQKPEAALQPFRDHYVLPVDDAKAAAFEASPWWRFSLLINNGRDAVWKVTPEGREAVAEWLKSGGAA